MPILFYIIPWHVKNDNTNVLYIYGNTKKYLFI